MRPEEVTEWLDGDNCTVTVENPAGVLARMTLEQAAVSLRFGGPQAWYYQPGTDDDEPKRPKRYAILHVTTGTVIPGPGPFDLRFEPDA